MRLGKIDIDLARGLSQPASWTGTACWWRLRIRFRWRETHIYFRPFKVWWNSEHLARWFGKHIESDWPAPGDQWILNSRILGYHWSD